MHTSFSVRFNDGRLSFRVLGVMDKCTSRHLFCPMEACAHALISYNYSQEIGNSCIRLVP